MTKIKYYYSPTHGFKYVHEDGSVYGYDLNDFIELPEYYVNFLMERQGKNCTIESRENGLPYLQYDDPEIHLAEIRRKSYDKVRIPRDNLLKETDWTQMPDIPEHIREPYKEYRQKLRDIPQQKGFPHAVIWPKEPNTKKEP